MICNLKNVLSIGDIKQVMTLLMAEGVQAKGMQEIFEKDRENQKELKESINVMVDRLKQNYDEEMDTIALVSLLLSFAGIAAYCRKTSEAIIDRFLSKIQRKKYKIEISRDRISPDAVPAYFLLHNQKREDIMYEYAHIVTDTEGEIKRLSAKKALFC